MAFLDKVVSAEAAGQMSGQLIFITGAPGTGKTTMIGSLCDMKEYDGHVLVMSAGGGMRSLADRKGVAVVPVTKWQDIKDAITYLNSKDSIFKVIAIDLVSEAYSICLEEYRKGGMATKTGSRVTLEGYGSANDRLIEAVRDLRMLAEQKGIHVIFTSHTQESKDDDSGMILVRANLTPGTLSTVLGIVDVACYLDFKKGKRIMYLEGTERIWAKARKPLSMGPVTAIVEDPTFAKLFKEIGL